MSIVCYVVLYNNLLGYVELVPVSWHLYVVGVVLSLCLSTVPAQVAIL